MAISLDEFEQIKTQMPQGGKGDEIEPLTEKDEIALDKAWQKVAEENAEKKKRATV